MCFVIQNTRINKANQDPSTIFRAPPMRPYLFVFSGKNASITSFVFENTQRKKANQGSGTRVCRDSGGAPEFNLKFPTHPWVGRSCKGKVEMFFGI